MRSSCQLFSVKFSLVSLFLALALTQLPVNAVAASENNAAPAFSAGELIEEFHAALLGSARLDAGFATRSERFGVTLDKVFDLQRIARISVGREWRALDKSAQAELQTLLRAVVIGTYVSRFDEDRGQKLEVLGVTEVKSGRWVVNAQIVRPGGAKVLLDYYLRGQRVFNVVADGVSDLSVRRADYASIIQAGGIPGLIEHLSAQHRQAASAFASKHGP